MMFKQVILTGVALFALAAQAEEKKIGAAEAADHFDKKMTVTGTVAQVTIREKLVYINLDKPFPQTPLAGVIFARATNGFGDLNALKGKQVEITGKIEEYKERPQIILTSTNQLKVVK
jgi:DNA/RNA endonuclease YhcR with UshA esterase domain